MHTANLIKTKEFTFNRGTTSVSFSDIFPNFTTRDRVGIVASGPGDSLKAAPLLLASIGAFYEELFSAEKDFYLYPDYFVFHIGGLKGRHSTLDIWPQSKEVVVPADPQALLAAINDRGITRLILPLGPGASGLVMVHAAQLAARRLTTMLTTDLSFGGPTWAVKPSGPAAAMIARCAKISRDLLGEEVADQWADAPGTAQGYSEINIDECLSALCAVGPTDESLGFTKEYRLQAGLTEKIFARDRYTVTAPWA